MCFPRLDEFCKTPFTQLERDIRQPPAKQFMAQPNAVGVDELRTSPVAASFVGYLYSRITARVAVALSAAKTAAKIF